MDSILEDFRHEITLMKKLKFHPNIVQIFGVTFREAKPIVIVELGNETLDVYLWEKAAAGAPASWFEKTMLCLDVSKGTQGLHDAGIVHGDLKGENILIFIKVTGVATAKISDFGYSSTLTSKGTTTLLYSIKVSFVFLDWVTFLYVINLGFVGGTPNFMAPEATGEHPELKSWQKNPAQDVFSFGLVTYQIATNGEKPYDGAENIFEAKAADRDMEGLLATLPSDVPEQFRTIITKATKFIPSDRVSLDEVEQILRNFLTTTLLPQGMLSFEGH